MNSKQTAVASQPPAPRSRKRSGLLGWVYRGMLPADRWKFWWCMVIGLCYTAMLMTPAAPLLYRPFVPLPTLEQAHHWKGTIKVVPDSSWHWPGTRAAYRYFIQTEQGEFEFHDGYWGRRSDFFWNQIEKIQGAKAEIWYDPFYGILKHEILINGGLLFGKIDRQPYESAVNFFNHKSSHDSYIWTFLLSLLPLIYQIWYVKKWFRTRYIKASSKERRGLK